MDIYVPWQNQNLPKALPIKSNKTSDNQPKSIENTPNLAKKKDLTSRVDVLDSNDNIVFNVNTSTKIIPKSSGE